MVGSVSRVKKLGSVLGGLLLFVAATTAGYGYSRVTTLQHSRLSDDVFVISGFGGNVGVLRSSVGTVVVDTMNFPFQGKRIKALAEKIGGAPVRIVINTHYHRDHTHGNPAFGEDVSVVATENTLAHLLAKDREFWAGDNRGGLPDQTFAHEHTLELGDKTLRLYQFGRGHTDGDLVVEFVEDRIIHAGDLLFNESFPNIDLEAGGSIPRWIGTLDRILALNFDRVIPGHGKVTDAGGVRAYQRFLRDLWKIGAEAAARGLSLEQTLGEADLSAYENYAVMSIPFVLTLDRDFVVKRSWQEATAAVVAKPVRP